MTSYQTLESVNQAQADCTHMIEIQAAKTIKTTSFDL